MNTNKRKKKQGRKKGRKRCIASAGETSAVQTRLMLTLSHQPLLWFIATCKQQEGGLQSCCNTQVGPFKRLKTPALNTESIRGSAYPWSLWSHAAGRCGEPQPRIQHRKDADCWHDWLLVSHLQRHGWEMMDWREELANSRERRIQAKGPMLRTWGRISGQGGHGLG